MKKNYQLNSTDFAYGSFIYRGDIRQLKKRFSEKLNSQEDCDGEENKISQPFMICTKKMLLGTSLCLIWEEMNNPGSRKVTEYF